MFHHKWTVLNTSVKDLWDMLWCPHSEVVWYSSDHISLVVCFLVICHLLSVPCTWLESRGDWAFEAVVPTISQQTRIHNGGMMTCGLHCLEQWFPTKDKGSWSPLDFFFLVYFLGFLPLLYRLVERDRKPEAERGEWHAETARCGFRRLQRGL